MNDIIVRRLHGCEWYSVEVSCHILWKIISCIFLENRLENNWLSVQLVWCMQSHAYLDQCSDLQQVNYKQ